MKLGYGCVDGGIFMVRLKEFVNLNSNKYLASIVLDTLRMGLMSEFVGSDGYDYIIDNFIK